MLAEIGAAREVRVSAIAYAHCSLLPAGRGRILADAINDEHADILLSVDSDVWMERKVLELAIGMAHALFATTGTMAQPDAALLGVAVAQDDRRPNIWTAPHRKIGNVEPPIGRAFECYAMGAGITLHNLRWHRRLLAAMHSDEHRAMWPTVGYAVVPHPTVPLTWVGEDYYFCEQVHARGGKVLGLYTQRGTYHRAAGA